MPMSNALVSIIIPCFNAAATLAETLQSCLDQEHADFEIIVVDDHSTDGSRAVVETIAASDARVRWFANAGKGQSAARNFGMDQAKGSFIKFLDADDCLSADVLGEQVTCLEGRQRALAFCAWAHFLRSLGDRAANAQPTDRSSTSVDEFLAELWRGNMYPPHAWLIPRELLDAEMRWDESLTQNEDGEFFARLIATAQELQFSSGTAYYRKPLEGHVSQRSGIQQMKSQLRVLRSYRKVCATMGDFPHLLEAYHYQVCCVAYRAATTMEEMSELPASLDLLELHRAAVPFEFPSEAMKAVSKWVGIRKALRFRAWITRWHRVLTSAA